MPHSFLVLHDLTPHARQALRVAHQWSLWTGAELHLLHNLEAAFVPAMADQEVRQQLVTSFRTEAYNKLQHSYEEITGKPARPEHVHLSLKSLTASIYELINLHDTQLLFAGLKSHGVLKRMIIGSTVLKLLEHVTIPVVAVPESMRELQQLTLHVAVSYRHIFNSIQLKNFIQLMGEKIAALVFISVLTKDDDPQQAASHLAALKATFTDRANVSSCLFEGEAPFAQVKAYMKEQTDGVLLAQRGSRAFSDNLFRSFFIDELVQDASVPLIILP